MPCVVDRGKGQRQSLCGCSRGGACCDPTLGFQACVCAREQRGCVSICAHAEKYAIKARPGRIWKERFEGGFECLCSGVGRGFVGGEWVAVLCGDTEGIEKGFASHSGVALFVVVRDKALIAPVKRHAFPGHAMCVLCGEVGIQCFGCATARKDEVIACLLGECLCDVCDDVIAEGCTKFSFGWVHPKVWVCGGHVIAFVGGLSGAPATSIAMKEEVGFFGAPGASGVVVVGEAHLEDGGEQSP